MKSMGQFPHSQAYPLQGPFKACQGDCFSSVEYPIKLSLVPTIDPIILCPKVRRRITPQAWRKDVVQFMIDSVEGTQFGRGYVGSYECPRVSRYGEFVGRWDVLHDSSIFYIL